MKTNLDQQPESAPTHRRYWLDEKGVPWCCDCTPPLNPHTYEPDETQKRINRQLGVSEEAFRKYA